MKISYCTFLLNNLLEVKKNFIFNLNCTKYFNGNVEWIILNINNGSDEFDETDKYIRKYSPYFIKKNLVKYYVIETKNINISALKNTSHQLANYDFIINLNINTRISLLDTEVLLHCDNNKIIYRRQETDPAYFCNEIIGMNKENFILLKGYNENFEGYGYIVDDMINRIKKLDLEIIVFTSLDYNSLKYFKDSTQTMNYAITFQKNKSISELPFDNSVSNDFLKIVTN